MTKGKVSGIIANMVTLTVDGPVSQNEICYILLGGQRLMAEVIKVVGAKVYVQVFESTRGLKVGAEAEFMGHMLEVQLAPGMLSKSVVLPTLWNHKYSYPPKPPEASVTLPITTSSP